MIISGLDASQLQFAAQHVLPCLRGVPARHVRKYIHSEARCAVGTCANLLAGDIMHSSSICSVSCCGASGAVACKCGVKCWQRG
jgi:hypothetical protein